MKKFIREKLITKITQLELDIYHQTADHCLYSDEALEKMSSAASTDVIREQLNGYSIKQLWTVLRIDLLRMKSNKLANKFNEKLFKDLEDDEEE